VLILEELKIAMTVDEYIFQLNELMILYFPQAQLMPGMISSLFSYNTGN